jgi:hypothetical protein
MTADSDTSNGTWSTAQTGTAGNATSASNIEIISQFKIQTTTTSTQTFNIGITANTWGLCYILLTEKTTPLYNAPGATARRRR